MAEDWLAFSERLNDFLFTDFLADWLVGWITYQVTSSSVIDLLTYWLTELSFHSLTYSSASWLWPFGCLTDYLPERQSHPLLIDRLKLTGWLNVGCLKGWLTKYLKGNPNVNWVGDGLSDVNWFIPWPVDSLTKRTAASPSTDSLVHWLTA